MKLLAILLLATQFVFAKSFNFSLSANTINTQSSGTYVLMPTVEVEVIQTLAKSALIKVNGETKEYKTDILSRSNDMGEIETIYRATLKSEMLVDMICDEREEVSYDLIFTEFTEPHYSAITSAELEVTIMYTYDWCHSYPSIETIKYQLN